MGVSVRSITEQDWELSRALRLRALAEDPDAFASSLEKERGFADAQWQAWSRSNAERRATAGFYASLDGVEVGLIVGVRKPHAVQLNALWVAPEARGRGAASALIEAVAGWAAESGVRELELEVTETSRAARHLYEKLGFAVAGAARTCGVRQAPSLYMRRVS
jgi:ribosomal protein S18 acetylase RimI-like enzyme